MPRNIDLGHSKTGKNAMQSTTYHEMAKIEEYIDKFKGALGQLFDIDDLPVPFACG